MLFVIWFLLWFAACYASYGLAKTRNKPESDEWLIVFITLCFLCFLLTRLSGSTP